MSLKPLLELKHLAVRGLNKDTACLLLTENIADKGCDDVRQTLLGLVSADSWNTGLLETPAYIKHIKAKDRKLLSTKAPLSWRTQEHLGNTGTFPVMLSNVHCIRKIKILNKNFKTR